MRWKAILPFMMFAIFLAPANGQGPAAYFSVSTNKTFLPGEKIGIRLYATNVDALEFRVYKVKDPIAFFERLDNPHGFGHTSMREQIETPTVIERFHDWKYELWVRIPDFFRVQFSARSRAGRGNRSERRDCRRPAGPIAPRASRERPAVPRPRRPQPRGRRFDSRCHRSARGRSATPGGGRRASPGQR